MSKYIIKNCPCILIDECNSFRDDEIYCKDCTDCLLKQIVEKCKLQAQVIGLSGKILSEKILKLLDIQEVE